MDCAAVTRPENSSFKSQLYEDYFSEIFTAPTGHQLGVIYLTSSPVPGRPEGEVRSSDRDEDER